MSSTVEVVVSVDGRDRLAGLLRPAVKRGTQVGSTFSYADAWLSYEGAYSLDPGLPLVPGPLQTDAGVTLFGAFRDCAPNRWGRTLVQRAERAQAGEEARAPRALHDIEFLLGARDDLRQGALRFRIGDGPFLAEEATGVPAVADLGELLDLSARQERDALVAAELRRLVRAGSSLGGARPKAHVRRVGGGAAIAKFPSVAADTWDVMAWEAVALDLAQQSGIDVPTFQLVRIGGRSVLVVDRFDRAGTTAVGQPKRIGYVSAMTMLAVQDGDIADFDDIAEVVEERSPDATRELRELWRRLVFSALISNTDNHLRNHGFLHHARDSWRLAPAFDLNPDPQRTDLATGVAGHRDAPVGAAIDHAALFRLDADHARDILREVVEAVAGWRAVAARHGLAAQAQAEMAPAFEHVAAQQASALIG